MQEWEGVLVCNNHAKDHLKSLVPVYYFEIACVRRLHEGCGREKPAQDAICSETEGGYDDRP